VRGGSARDEAVELGFDPVESMVEAVDARDQVSKLAGNVGIKALDARIDRDGEIDDLPAEALQRNLCHAFSGNRQTTIPSSRTASF
jgi:hypothetical protein